MFSYKAAVQYEGTPHTQMRNIGKYNAPKFIPVHLKSRHVKPSIKPMPERIRNKTKFVSSYIGVKSFLHKKKQAFEQSQLKSLINIESMKPQRVTSEAEIIKPINNTQEKIETTKASPIKLTSNDTKNKAKNMTTDRTISKIISREQQTDERYLQPKTHNKHVKPKQKSKHSNNVSKVIKKTKTGILISYVLQIISTTPVNMPLSARKPGEMVKHINILIQRILL